MGIWETTRVNGETGRAEVIGTSKTAEEARRKADEAKQDAKIARKGNSDSYGVRKR